jgi:hypothetical protein
VIDVSPPIYFRSYEYGLELHAQMIQRDVVAFEQLANLMYSPLVQAITRYADNTVKKGVRPWASENARDEAIMRTLFAYQAAPEKYDPALGKSLFRYLVMSAERDYLNEIDKELRRIGKWDALDVVDIFDDGQEHDQSERQLPADVNIEELIEAGESQVWAEIRLLLTDPRDLQCAWYMLEGVRETSVYVDVYGLHHLPPNEQDHEVKKHKDRIKKKLGRKLDPEDFRNHD